MSVFFLLWKTDVSHLVMTEENVFLNSPYWAKEEKVRF